MPARPRTNREWFVDRRAPDRRLQVTWHREHRAAVLSVWHGDVCVATFQLPAEDAARLIAHLADGLAEITTTDLALADDVESRRGTRSARIAAWLRRSRAVVRHQRD